MGDLQIYKPEIVQQVSGEQKSPQEVLNSVIEKQKQLIIEGIKEKLLKDGITQEKINTLKFYVVGNIGLVVNSKGKIHSFYKYGEGNGVEYYTNIKGLEKDSDLHFGESESGYNLKDGKLSKNGQEVSEFLKNGSINPEFIKGIDDITFFGTIQSVFGAIKTLNKGKKLEYVDIESFNLSIISGVTRIKEVMFFYSKGYIPEKDFEGLLLRAIKELPNQCSDIRFYQNGKGQKMGMEVTKSELDEYLRPTKGPPLITQSMYDNCLKRIEARDRKINEMNGVKEQGKTERDIGKTQIGVVGKVRSILGF